MVGQRGRKEMNIGPKLMFMIPATIVWIIGLFYMQDALGIDTIGSSFWILMLGSVILQFIFFIIALALIDYMGRSLNEH